MALMYDVVIPGVLLPAPTVSSPRVAVDGQEVTAHVKNTGRCRELLLPGARSDPVQGRKGGAQNRL